MTYKEKIYKHITQNYYISLTGLNRLRSYLDNRTGVLNEGKSPLDIRAKEVVKNFIRHTYLDIDYDAELAKIKANLVWRTHQGMESKQALSKRNKGYRKLRRKIDDMVEARYKRLIKQGTPSQKQRH